MSYFKSWGCRDKFNFILFKNISNFESILGKIMKFSAVVCQRINSSLPLFWILFGETPQNSKRSWYEVGYFSDFETLGDRVTVNIIIPNFPNNSNFGLILSQILKPILMTHQKPSLKSALHFKSLGFTFLKNQ